MAWLALMLCGCPAFGQWVPLSGTQTSTVETLSADGRVTGHRVTKERYYRASSGSVLVQQMANDGSNVPAAGTLIDYGKTGKTYSLNYRSGAAVDKHRPARPMRPMTRADLAPPSEKNGMREETVKGVRCVVAPVYKVNANGTRTLIGHGWAAPEYNFLMVKQDTVRSLSDGRMVHVVREMENVTAGAEPEPRLFKLDPDSVKRARIIVPPKAK